jgi:EAL domain-containing protein (putative c-di-GMP-specific phosphodiesterase class I)
VDQWDDKKRALCEAIVSMGHAMGLKVVAEGIETQEQRERIARLHCDFGQGYLFGQPMSLGDLESFLRGPASGD